MIVNQVNPTCELRVECVRNRHDNNNTDTDTGVATATVLL